MPFTNTEVGELGEIALAVARDAAALVVAGYRSRPRATEQARADIVTDFDLRSEEGIRERLARLSSLPVVGEERGGPWPGLGPRGSLARPLPPPLRGRASRAGFVHQRPARPLRSAGGPR